MSMRLVMLVSDEMAPGFEICNITRRSSNAQRGPSFLFDNVITDLNR